MGVKSKGVCSMAGRRFPWEHRQYAVMSILLFSSALFILSSLYVTVPLISLFALEFQVSPEQASLAGSAFSLLFAAGCFIYGPLSDRLGRKKVMVSGLAVLAVVTLLIGMSESFTVLLILRCVQGAAAATFSPVALTYAGEMFPGDRKVTAIGYISTGFLMAGILGQVWGSGVEQWGGWQTVFASMACVYFILVIGLALLLPPAPSNKAAGKETNPLRQAGAVLRNRSLLLCYGITITVLLCFVGAYSAMGQLLGGAPFHLHPNEILGIRAVGIAGMVLSPLAGRLGRRFGVSAVLRAGLSAAIAGLIAMGMVHQPYLYAAVSILFAAGISLLVPSLISLIGELGGPYRATATSLYTFILFIGASLGPVVTTTLLKHDMPSLPFLAFAGLLGCSFMLSLFVRLPSTNHN